MNMKRKSFFAKMALASAVLLTGGVIAFSTPVAAAGDAVILAGEEIDILDYIPATEARLNKTELTLRKGDKETLILTVNPEDMNDVICWTSDNYDIVEVDQNGTVTAKDFGTATVHAIILRNLTVSGNDPFANAIEVTCKVSVTQPVSDLMLNKSNKVVHVGESYALQATIIPVNASNKEVTWTSEDASIATVDEKGTVTAVAPGKVNIKVTSNADKSITNSCAVKVTQLVPLVFGDIKKDDWWTDAVQFVYDYDIMQGTKAGFEPNALITREMFVQTLYNQSGKPGAEGITNNFTDVVMGQWYTDAVLWGNKNDVVVGFPSGRFGVGENITREQLTVVLYKYAKMNKYDLTYSKGLIDQFKDGKDVHNWASEAMNWAVSQGIMSGKGTGEDKSQYRLDPLGNATRAECAQMIMKLLTKNGVYVD